MNLLRLCLLPFISGLFVLFAVLADEVRADDFDEAKAAFYFGEYDQCIELCEAATQELAHRQDWPILKARTELTLGRYENAKATVEEGLITHANSVRLRMIGVEVYRFNQDEARALELQMEIERLYDRSSWRYRDGVNQVAIGKYLLGRGADAKQVLDRFYNRIKGNQPALVDPYIAIGELGLAKNDYQLAATNFRRALQLQENNPDIMFGLAEALAPSDFPAAAALIEQALVVNERHIPSLLSIADNQINAESYDDANKTLDEILEINPHQPEAWAYRAVVAHLLNKPDDETKFRKKALEFWQSNPGVDHLIGKKLAQKYRFSEAAAYQKRALIYDANFTPAKIQLAQDVLRLGNEREGWKLADEVYNQDAYNIAAYNLVTLRDQIENFETIETNQFVIRMDPLEARLYGPRVKELLIQASELLTKKYDIEITTPVIIEIFYRQQDFAIRTFGTPGGDGFLGVCFGNVVTMNSPSAQGANLTSWESVLWHEFCHVVTLQKTRNKMPRWLSEGISVYEERLANPAWGQSMTPRYREMILGEDLTPVSELSAAFLQPKSGLHLQFAYFESAMVVDYLVEKYGIDTLKRILDDLRIGMPINESLARYCGSIELLDKEFAEHARAEANKLVADGDLTDPEFAPGADINAVESYLKDNPDNAIALQHLAAKLMGERRMDEAVEVCNKLIDLGVNFSGLSNPHRMLSEIYRFQGDTKNEKIALNNYLQVDVDSLEPLVRLMEISKAEKNWAELSRYAQQFLAVNPLLPISHRFLAEAAIANDDHQMAIDSLNAVIALDPLDPAEAHFQLATAYFNQGEIGKAKRSVLKSLEEAPRYRAAHELLRTIAELEKQDIRSSGNH